MTCLKLMLEIMGKDMAAVLNHKPSRATAPEKVCNVFRLNKVTI